MEYNPQPVTIRARPDPDSKEAVEFYRQAIGAEVALLMRFKDSPDPAMCAPGTENKVMHARLLIGKSAVLVSDGRCGGQAHFAGFSLSLTVATVAESERYFAALAEGGTIRMPLTKTFYSPSFGMLADRFGVGWMVYVHA